MMRPKIHKTEEEIKIIPKSLQIDSRVNARKITIVIFNTGRMRTATNEQTLVSLRTLTYSLVIFTS